MSNTLLTNQFQQGVVAGDLDLNIMAGGAFAGVLSANQDTPAVTVQAGTPAKIDTSITAGFVPNFLQAAVSDVAIGYFKRTAKKALFAIGDVVEVAITAGPVMWLLAEGTITPGAKVESATDLLGVVTLASGKARGIALDYGTSGQLIRVILAGPFSLAS